MSSLFSFFRKDGISPRMPWMIVFDI